jgi:hypothetical protein
MVRGIEKKTIVEGDRDREDFIRRMGEIAIETGTGIYAWALLMNHVNDRSNRATHDRRNRAT